MPKKTKADMAKMGKEMTSLAKNYRKKHPSAKWSTAMKEAGKAYKSKHKRKGN